MKEPKFAWGYGKLSNYKPCCIAWFYLRRTFYVESGMYYTGLGKKINEHFSRSKFQHIICPAHLLLHKLGKYPAVYHTCEECGWVQYGKSNICLIKNSHQTWIRKEIDQYYKECTKEQRIVMRPGRIAKEIRNKYGIPEGSYKGKGLMVVLNKKLFK